MSEEMKMLLALVEENTRLKLALENLKVKMKNDKEASTTRDHALLNETELNEVLEIAGMLDRNVDVITFDNCREVAYGEKLES